MIVCFQWNHTLMVQINCDATIISLSPASAYKATLECIWKRHILLDAISFSEVHGFVHFLWCQLRRCLFLWIGVNGLLANCCMMVLSVSFRMILFLIECRFYLDIIILSFIERLSIFEYFVLFYCFNNQKLNNFNKHHLRASNWGSNFERLHEIEKKVQEKSEQQ